MNSFLAAAAAFALIASARSQAASDADTWLRLIDEGHFAESWSRASTPFQSKIASGDWVKQIGSVRASLGHVRSRELTSEQLTHHLSDAPDGDYDVLQYRATYDHKANAVEVVVMNNEKREWRVTGYFVR